MDLEWWAYLIGYSFAIVIGHFGTNRLVDELWESILPNEQERKQVRPFPEHPRMVGVVERGLYVTAILFNQLLVVGFWLVLKTAGQWAGWRENVEPGRGKSSYPAATEQSSIPGRSIYNIFLIGSGVSLGYAAAGAGLTKWLSDDQWGLAATTAVAMVVANGVLRWWVSGSVATPLRRDWASMREWARRSMRFVSRGRPVRLA